MLRYLFLLTFLSSEIAKGQDLEFLSEVPIEKPFLGSLDRKGALFLAEHPGVVNKYSKDGELELTYSPPRISKIGLIEAWSTLDVLVFYSGFQSVSILNRFLVPITEVSLEDKIGFARLATISNESNLWVIDDSDFSLKLLDLQLDQTTISTPFNQILDPVDYDITYLREYQNQLFILDKNSGILIFDNLGNHLRTIEVSGLDFIGFLNDELYYSDSLNLKIKNIYTEEERSIPLPEVGTVLMSRERIFLIQDDVLKVYAY